MNKHTEVEEIVDSFDDFTFGSGATSRVVFRDRLRQALTKAKEDALQKATYDELIEEWLKRYEGIEHMHVKPEAMLAVNTILGRCFKKLKNPN